MGDFVPPAQAPHKQLVGERLAPPLLAMFKRGQLTSPLLQRKAVFTSRWEYVIEKPLKMKKGVKALCREAACLLFPDSFPEYSSGDAESDFDSELIRDALEFTKMFGGYFDYGETFHAFRTSFGFWKKPLSSGLT